MFTSDEHEDELTHSNCGCGHCDGLADTGYDDEDAYDDPYEVIMYDIDAEADDLYALIEMLEDSARSWYAHRRLNALSASGRLSDLVAAIIIDSLGRRWNPLEHPRDRFGQFIETGGFLRWVMGGLNLRGQVSRIDSDGRIHVRSVGNDNIPDGTVLRFKPEQASKLIRIADPKAGLSNGPLPDIDLDADIPDFPEASPTQKRIYNTLQHGDMPAEDLDRAINTGDLDRDDFSSEVLGLKERGLVEIEQGDKPRVRRHDDADLGVIDAGDDEVAEVGDDETPDLDDSPALTKVQRQLLDRIVDADRGEGDGVGRDELDGVDDADLQALVDAGMLDEGDEGRVHLANPEAKADLTPGAAPEADITQEIFDAAGKYSKDPDAQDAFQHYAEELARPGDPNNAELPDEVPAAKRRTAETAAKKWWADRSGGSDVDEAVLDQREADDFADADVPEAAPSNPKDALNPENKNLAEILAAELISTGKYSDPDEAEKYLDSKSGVELTWAAKNLFDAEDYDAAGDSDRARYSREAADKALKKITKAPPKGVIEGLPDSVREARLADQEKKAALPDAPEVEEEAAPDIDAAETLRQAVHGVPEGYAPDADADARAEEAAQRSFEDYQADLAAEEVSEDDVEAPGGWEEFSNRISEESAEADVFGRVDRENRIADELGLDLRDDDAPMSWDRLSESIGYGPAELLFNDTDGDIEVAATKDPDLYFRQFEDGLLEKFQSNPSSPGPEVMRLRQAGLIEPTEDNGWQLTDAGRERLGLSEEEEDIVEPDENDLLQKFVDRPEGTYGPEVMRLRRSGLIEVTEDGKGWQLSKDGRDRLGLADELPAETEIDDPLGGTDERLDLPLDPVLNVGGDVPEADAPEDVVPEPDVVPDDVPETDEAVDIPGVDFANLDKWVDWQKRLNSERGPAEDLNDELVREKAIADELGIDLFAGDGLVNWSTFVQTTDPDVAEALYRKHDGNAGMAAMDLLANPEKWDNQSAPAAPDVEDALPEEDRDLLTRILNGGQAKRSERALEDALIDSGLLEEDENGDSRLTDAGRAALGEDDEDDDGADIVIDDTPLDVSTDINAEDVAADVDDAMAAEEAEDAAEALADDAASTQTTNAFPAPTLPNPADPNDATPGFRKISGAGGLNAGGIYEVTEDNGPLKVGDKVYIKNGRSYEHAQNEILANRLYALAGVEVPEIIEGSTGDRIASRVVDDLHDLDVYNPADAAVLDRVRDEFIFDAWIANWDGMNPGNTMVTPDGTPYRIDVGSAMEFRAQGGLKGAAFGDSVADIDTLRDASLNFETALVFGPMGDDAVAASAQRLAQVNPEDIRQTISTSGLPDKDALADKMVARRESVLQRFGISDPFGGDSSATVEDAVGPEIDADVPDVTATVRPTPAAIATGTKTYTARQQKDRRAFENRTIPHLEVTYDDSGLPITADGSVLDFDTYYRTGAGGESKIGKVIEILDQDRSPGWVKMEFPDGTTQGRHVLGEGKGKGGLRPTPEEDLDKWERQTSVTGDQETAPYDPADFPMSDGGSPLVGTRVALDVGGREAYGTIIRVNPKSRKVYIIPEGGGKEIARPPEGIRAQTPGEIDADAAPQIPYQTAAVKAQYLPQPRYAPDGSLLSRKDKAIHLGDWLGQRSGGDSLIGEVIDIPDQNLYPGWVTLRFPDGEERSRHVEGFTDVNRTRGAGGLHHVSAPPDMKSWTRQRRVKGEEGDVLSYDFSTLDTLDGTQIQVGQEVFGTDRKGAGVAGLLIRINPHMKRGGVTVPTGFVWQDGREISVDISKITNTVPQSAPASPRIRSFTTPSVPSGVRTTPGQATPTGAAPSPRGPTTRPGISPHNTAPAYTPGKGIALTDDEVDGLDTDPSRLRTSDRTNGLDARLAAIYEAQDFDALPVVVDQAEAERLVKEEGYVPILRSVHGGTDQKSGMEYTDAFRYGPYFAGNGIHGNGSYFAYGRHGLSESSQYGPRRIYALARPSDLKTIDKWDLVQMQRDDLRAISAAMQGLDSKSEEYAKLRRREKMLQDEGRYAASKGYDAITVKHGNSNYDNGPFPDENLSDWGYLVLLNRSSIIGVDTYFRDVDDIFNRGFPADLAPPAVLAEAAEDLAAPATPGVV